jgi:hypothetical protein
MFGRQIAAPQSGITVGRFIDEKGSVGEKLVYTPTLRVSENPACESVR